MHTTDKKRPLRYELSRRFTGDGRNRGVGWPHRRLGDTTGKPAIWLRKQFWRNGFSSERADAMLELAFERLDLDLVTIPVQDSNDRSRKAVEKYISAHGGQYDGVIRNSTARPMG